MVLLALPTKARYQGKEDIVFRFIIEYNSLRDVDRPLGIRSVFYMRIFERLIFWLVLKLEISYKVMIS
jgi:hypothetical protein